jgi:hypothetical protein
MKSWPSKVMLESLASYLCAQSRADACKILTSTVETGQGERWVSGCAAGPVLSGAEDAGDFGDGTLGCTSSQITLDVATSTSASTMNAASTVITRYGFLSCMLRATRD